MTRIPDDENPFITPEEAAAQNPNFEELVAEFDKQRDPEDDKS